MNNDLMFSSKDQNWATRISTFKDIESKLNRQYLIDPCCEEHTAKCPKYITKEDDLFSIGDLREHFDIESSDELQIFMNPPYGRVQFKFVNYVKNLCELDSKLIVDVLIPARTDTRLFHELVLPYATTIRFIRGRLTFGTDAYWEYMWKTEYLENGKKNSLYGKHGKTNPAAFPSMVVSFGEDKPLSYETLELTKAGYPDIVL
jgi:site-specific DNA-methyltransferase (adenine-specific)